MPAKTIVWTHTAEGLPKDSTTKSDLFFITRKIRNPQISNEAYPNIYENEKLVVDLANYCTQKKVWYTPTFSRTTGLADVLGSAREIVEWAKAEITTPPSFFYVFNDE